MLGATPAPPRRTPLPVVAVVFALVGPIGWLIFAALFAHTPGQDWMVFDTAVQAWRRGDIALLLDGQKFTAVLNATHAAWLTDKLVFHPWVYPPFTLLLVLPFCLLPFGASYILFQALSFAGLALALRAWAPDRRRYALLLAGVILCPATAFTIGAGQNSFFTASLILGGMALLGPRPIAAGMLLGLLVFKPQFAVLVPVALLAAGAWRALGACAATALALLAFSLIVPGMALWAGWLHLFLHGGSAFHTWVNEGRINGQSIFSCLALLGVPERLANAAQMAGIGFGAVCVAYAFRRNISAPRRLAVLLCCTILAAPHVGAYDGLLLALAGLLLLCTDPAARRGTAVWLAAALWISTAINPPHVFALTIPPLFYVSILTPLVAVGMVFWVLARSRQQEGVLF